MKLKLNRALSLLLKVFFYPSRLRQKKISHISIISHAERKKFASLRLILTDLRKGTLRRESQSFFLLVCAALVPLTIGILLLQPSLFNLYLVPVTMLAAYVVGLYSISLGTGLPFLSLCLVIVSSSSQADISIPFFVSILVYWLSGVILSPMRYTVSSNFRSTLFLLYCVSIFSSLNVLNAPALYTTYYKVEFRFISVVAAFLSFWIGYFRFADFGYYCAKSFIVSKLDNFAEKDDLAFLYKLPPYVGELASHPMSLPGHAILLTRAYMKTPHSGLKVHRKMFESKHLSIRETVVRALPKIISDQIGNVVNINDIIKLLSENHLVLSELLPILYQEPGDAFYFYKVKSPFYEKEYGKAFLSNNDFSIILILTRSIAEDLKRNIELGSFATRRKDLERILSRLISIEQELYRLTTQQPNREGWFLAKAFMLLISTVQFISRNQFIDALEDFVSRLPTFRHKDKVTYLLFHTKLNQPEIESEFHRWKTVLSKWKAAIELELLTLAKYDKEDVINPFQAGNPLSQRRADLFKGRRGFVEKIYRIVLERSRPTLILHGPRRCGKSSLLLNLPMLLPKDLITVFLDAQSVRVSKNDACFCYSLVLGIYRAGIREGIISLPQVPNLKSFEYEPYVLLENWLDQSLQMFEKRQILITIDEFEQLGIAINNGNISINLFNELRHLIQFNEKLAFLFSGVHTLEDLGTGWNDFFISMEPIELSYLTPSEAKDLLQCPHPDFPIKYGPSIVDEIIKLTRAQPYLVQLVGSEIVSFANKNNTKIVEKEVLDAAIHSTLEKGELYFSDLLEQSLGNVEKQRMYGREIIRNLVEGRQSEQKSDTDARAVVKRMCKYHLLEKAESELSIEIPLVEMWIRTNQTYV